MHRIPIIGYVPIILTIAMSGSFHVSAQARLPQKATLKDGTLIVGYLSMSPAGNPIFTPANKSLVVDTAHIDKLDFEQNRDIEKPQKTMSRLQLQFWGNQQISVAQVTLTQDKTQVLLVDGKHSCYPLIRFLQYLAPGFLIIPLTNGTFVLLAALRTRFFFTAGIGSLEPFGLCQKTRSLFEDTSET